MATETSAPLYAAITLARETAEERRLPLYGIDAGKDWEVLEALKKFWTEKPVSELEREISKVEKIVWVLIEIDEHYCELATTYSGERSTKAIEADEKSAKNAISIIEREGYKNVLALYGAIHLLPGIRGPGNKA